MGTRTPLSQILPTPLAVYAEAMDLTIKVETNDLTLKALDSKFVLEDTSRPSTKAKDNNSA